LQSGFESQWGHRSPRSGRLPSRRHAESPPELHSDGLSERCQALTSAFFLAGAFAAGFLAEAFAASALAGAFSAAGASAGFSAASTFAGAGVAAAAGRGRAANSSKT